jgi:hypothetical protein
MGYLVRGFEGGVLITKIKVCYDVIHNYLHIFMTQIRNKKNCKKC